MMTEIEEESILSASLERRSVVNFSKHLIPTEDGGLHVRVLACWFHIHSVSGAASDNRIFIMGFPESPSEGWSVSDQYRLNREFWENGSQSFGAEPKSLYPVDVSHWSPLAMFAETIPVTVFDADNRIGTIDHTPLYGSLNLNGRSATYQGKTRGTEEDSDTDLLIPSSDGWFLHYRIDGSTVNDWMTISTKGESTLCKEALFELAVRS